MGAQNHLVCTALNGEGETGCLKIRSGFTLYLSFALSSPVPHRMITSQSLVKGCENIKPKAKWFVSSLLENYDLAEVSSQAGRGCCYEGQEGT